MLNGEAPDIPRSYMLGGAGLALIIVGSLGLAGPAIHGHVTEADIGVSDAFMWVGVGSIVLGFLVSLFESKRD